MTITIRDVAKHAKVGIATVSRVLNGHPSVRPETRQRVLAAIEELDFTPNLTAQTLSSGQTNLIGVFAPFFTRPVYVQRLIGIQEVMETSEYDLVLFSVNVQTKYDEYLKQVIRQRRVDALLIISMQITEEHILLSERMDIPLVLIETYNEYTTCVAIDNILGGQIATEYLLSLGHEQIAFIGDQLEGKYGFSATNERFIGYRYALAEADIDLPNKYHSFAPLEIHSQHQAMKQALQLLQLKHRPTAIFATSDTQAIGVLQAANKLDITIPNELSVIGFDDIEISSFFELTTIRQPMIESGRRGAKMLLSRLQSDQIEHRQEFLDLELIVRNTTAPL